MDTSGQSFHGIEYTTPAESWTECLSLGCTKSCLGCTKSWCTKSCLGCTKCCLGCTKSWCTKSCLGCTKSCLVYTKSWCTKSCLGCTKSCVGCTKSWLNVWCGFIAVATPCLLKVLCNSSEAAIQRPRLKQKMYQGGHLNQNSRSTPHAIDCDEGCHHLPNVYSKLLQSGGSGKKH